MGRVSKFSYHKKEAIRKRQVLLSYCNTLGDWGRHFDGGVLSTEMFAWWLHLSNQVKFDWTGHTLKVKYKLN